MSKEFINKIENTCSGFTRCLAGKPLFAIVFLFLIVLLSGVLIFYRYDILVKSSEPQILNETGQFQKEAYQQVLKEWQIRDERFTAADSQKYIDPFQAKR